MRAILGKTRKATSKMKENQRKEQAASTASPVTMINSGQQTNLGSTATAAGGSGEVVNSQQTSAPPPPPNTASVSSKAQSKLQSILYNQFGGKSANSPSLSLAPAGAAKQCKNVSPSGNTMLMSMLSDTPHAALASKAGAKKRKRSSTGSLTEMGSSSPSLKVFKQEHHHQESGECEKASSSSRTASSDNLSSSGSISSQDNDNYGVDNSGAHQAFYFIKQQGNV